VKGYEVIIKLFRGEGHSSKHYVAHVTSIASGLSAKPFWAMENLVTYNFKAEQAYIEIIRKGF
jgi:hypothetical protein